MGKPVEIEFLMKDRLTGGIKSAGGSVDAFGNKIDGTTRRIHEMGGAAESEFNRANHAGRRMAQGIAAFFTIRKGSELVSGIVDTRKEMEAIQNSLSVILKSDLKGSQMVLGFQDLAMESPIALNAISKAGQTLLGFGIEGERVIPILRQLSEISLGQQDRFEGLALAYSQSMSAGRLMGQDLLQMINAGFNPLQYISEKTGKSIGVLKDEMADGAISAEMVADAFREATEEGGRFYGMNQKNADGIRRSEAELKTTIVNTYNEIGKQHQGLITGSYEMATELVKNYEPIIKTLGVLIATYGTYKASMIAGSAFQGARSEISATIEAEELRKLLPLQEASANADIEQAVAKGQLTKAQAADVIALRAEIATKLDALKATHALAVSEAAEAAVAHKAALQRALASKQMVAQREMELSIARLSGDAAQIELAQKALLEAQEERHIAVKARKATADSLSIARSKSASAATAVETLQTNINTATTIAAAKAKNIFAIAGHKAATAIRSIGTAFKTNPIGWALTGIMAVTSAIGLFSDGTEKAEEDVLGLARAQRIAAEEYDKEAAKISTLQGILENANVSYDERKRSLDEIREIIPAYNGQLTEEGTIINNNTEAIKNYLAQLERQIKMKAAQEELEEAYREKRNLEKQRDADQKEIERIKSSLGYNLEGAVYADQNTVNLSQAKEALESTNTEISSIDRIIEELNSEIETTSVSTNNAVVPVKSFSEQLSEAKDTAARLKVELKDLLSGKGAEADFSKAIEDKSKALKKAEERVATLTGVDTGGKKSKQKQNQEQSTSDRLQKIDDYTRKVVAQVAESELEIRQSRIDAMDESVVKERAQIALDYDKLIQENRDRRDEMVRELRKDERLRWENDNPNYKEKGLVFTPAATEYDLSDGQKRVLIDYVDTANAYRIKAEDNLLKQVLEKYETYEQERARITREAEDRIALMREKNTAGQYDANIRNAEQERDNALAELDNAMQASTELWSMLFDDFSHYTNAELRSIIDNARQVLDYVNSTPDADIVGKFGMSPEQLRNLKANAADLGAAYDALGDKLREMGERDPFSGIVRSARELEKTTKDVEQAREELSAAEKSGDALVIKNSKEKLAGLNRQKALLKGDLKTAAKAAAGYLGDLGGSLESIGEAAGSAEIASIGKALGEVSDIAGKLFSGDIIGAAMTAITTGLVAIFSSASKYREALKQMRKDRAEFEHEYRMALAEMRLEAKDEENVFGEDLFAKALVALDELKRSYDEFIDRVNKRTETDDGGLFWMSKKFQRLREEIDDISTDLQNIWVTTRNSTWFRSSKGYYLKDKYPELFEGEYGFDVEAARALLETNDQLSEEARRQIQEVIDLYDQWKAAEDAFKEYLSSTFGEIGSSLGDSIVDAFRNGTDAMHEWAGSFSNVLENLGKQLMMTIFFQKHFDELQKNLEDIYNSDGKGKGKGPWDKLKNETDEEKANRIGKEIQDLLGNFFKGMGDTVDAAEEWWKEWEELANDNGFDFTDDIDQQSGKAGAFQTMSQDTGDELKGLFTAVQMHVASMDDKLDKVVSLYAASDRWLEQIADNTGTTAKGVSAILEEVRRMIRDGITVK